MQYDLGKKLQNSIDGLVEITEGVTKILVPKQSMTETVPPREPAFFNPMAKMNRDFSVLAYSAFWKNFEGPKIFLDGLSGSGARGLRVAKELKAERVIVNDINPQALEISLKSASLNDLDNFEVSENEVCRFFSLHSNKGNRGSIIDIDPFGSPVRYLDCGIRATMHGGLLSATATDLQVLHGLFNDACKRKYYGIPIKTEYANEIAIRLILGCMCFVANRLDIEIVPLFVENEVHYYRVYTKILNRPSKQDNIGFIFHCKTCGNRGSIKQQKNSCDVCNAKVELAGPLWIGRLFDKSYVTSMLEQVSSYTVDKKCEKKLQRCILESELPGTFFTVDEIGSIMKNAPLSIKKAVTKLEKEGFAASPTSLNPTGFRTNCRIDKIKEIFSS